jgi:hypothetical protein
MPHPPKTPGRFPKLRLVDKLILASLLVFTILGLIFLKHSQAMVLFLLKNLAVSLFFLACLLLTNRLRNRLLYFLVRTASVQLLFAYLYDSVQILQNIFFSWRDQSVLNLEERIFGVQPTVWLERFVSPGLTEWLMFAYVAYLVIYPAMAALIYFRKGPEALEDYLLTLGIANLACDIGFLLFPVAGPMYFIKDWFSKPLDGYFFTACGEFIRHRLHVIGGSIPSPHCAIATVMWLMAWRYRRPVFYILTPVILSLYVSTFFCRYHYLSDAVTGVLTGMAAFYLTPLLLKKNTRSVIEKS